MVSKIKMPCMEISETVIDMISLINQVKNAQLEKNIHGVFENKALVIIFYIFLFFQMIDLKASHCSLHFMLFSLSLFFKAQLYFFKLYKMTFCFFEIINYCFFYGQEKKYIMYKICYFLYQSKCSDNVEFSTPLICFYLIL